MARIVRITYSCKACGKVIAVNPWQSIGNPLRSCPSCGAPAIYSWFKEWEFFSSSERSEAYMNASAIPLLVGLIVGIGMTWAELPYALPAAAVTAIIGLAIGFGRLRAQIAESNQRLANPTYRQQLRQANQDVVAPPELNMFVLVCVFGLAVVAACLWMLIVVADLSEGLWIIMQLGVFVGGAILLWGLIALVPACLAERSIIRPILVLALIAGIAGFFWSRYRERGDALSGEELLALLDKQENSSEVNAAIERLGKRKGGAGIGGEWPQHNLRFGLDQGVVTSVRFGNTAQSPYAGTLPYGLRNFDDPPKVREKLGSPRRGSDRSTQGTFDIWQYPERGVNVIFSGGRLFAVEVVAPSRVMPPPPSADAVWNLPGRDAQHADFVALRKNVADQTLREHKFDQGKTQRWGDTIEVRFDKSDKISEVHLFERYLGDLPGGITFESNREAVRKKLGSPSPAKEFTDEFPEKGLLIRYTSKDSVYTVTVSAKK